MQSTVEANRSRIGAYLDWLSGTRNCSPHTYAAYSGTLNKLVVHLGATPLGAAPVGDLEAFVERPRARRSPNHVRGQVVVGSAATRRRGGVGSGSRTKSQMSPGENEKSNLNGTRNSNQK